MKKQWITQIIKGVVIKYLISFLVLFAGFFAQAETITCENQSQDIYQKVKLEIFVPENDYGFIESTSNILDVELVTEKNSWFGSKLKNLSCSVVGDIKTVSMCERLSEEKLNEKFLSVLRIGSFDEVEQMIDCGANVNTQDEYGCSPLLNLTDGACGYTKYNGKYPVYGFTRGTDLGKVISLLIDNGAVIEAQDPANLETPLIKLVADNKNYEIQTLIDYEVDINAQDIDGNTALMHAVASGKKILIKAVLEGEPDMEIKNKRGQTAYDIAIEYKLNNLLPLLATVEEKSIFQGQADGTCSPDVVMLTKGKSVKIILKASQNNMFLFESKQLGIELMATKASTDQVVFKPTKVGTFEFTCGTHAGSNPTKGTIMVH